jgi:hypothetical protein
MSDDRLNSILQAAVEAIRHHPDYRPTDHIAVILADVDRTVITSGGCSSLELAGLLRFHAGKLDRIG